MAGPFLARAVVSRWVAALAVLALAAAQAGCGRPAARERVWRVAVQAPLSGPRAELGLGVLRGVELAVEEARPAWRARGVRLDVAAYDEADPRQGVANAELIAADPAVLGVVGHLDSDVAVPASERYEQSGLAVLSVAATAPEFTARGLRTAHRLLPPDDAQGRAAARFAARALKARTAFVVHDRTAYGQGLADAFAAEARRLGLRVPAYRGLVRGGTLADLAGEIRGSGADLVFYAGDEEEAARLVRALRREGVTAAFLGGDALDGPAFAGLAGEAARGCYYVSLVPDPGALEQARAWAAVYRRRFAADPPGLALLAYDATRILLAAAWRATVSERAGDAARAGGAAGAARGTAGAHEGAGRAGAGAGLPDRWRVAAALREVRDFPGLAGPVAFDARGDNRHALARAPRVLRLEDGYPGVPVPLPDPGAAPEAGPGSSPR